MIKLLLIAFLSVFWMSCTESEENQNKVVVMSERKMDSVLGQIFLQKYPNFKSNDLVKEKALEELLSKVDSLAPLYYLEDLPLEIWNIGKNPNGEGAIVQFYKKGSYENTKQGQSEHLGFEIICFMSEELASTLNSKEKYYIHGKKYVRLTNNETYGIIRQSYFSPEPEITKNSISSDIYDYNIGVFLTEVDSVRLVKGTNTNE